MGWDGLVIGGMSLDDLPEIFLIEHASYPKPWSERMFRQEFENALGIQRAWREGGRLLGYIFAWIIFDDLHINNIAVAPEARRRGIGLALIHAVFDTAREKGAKRASLEVRSLNETARAMYEKLGFRRIADRKGYYEDTGDDALILGIEL